MSTFISTSTRTLYFNFAFRTKLQLFEDFPSSLKAVSEWFPQQERSLAVGVFNAGSNIGAIVTPLAVPAITLAWGWRAAFVVTGMATLVWLIAWLAIYRSPRLHERVTPAELEYIHSGEAPAQATSVSWLGLLRLRETAC